MQMLKLIFSLAVIIFSAQTTALAEDELFDTSSAAVHLEKGIAHLKAKQLDSAVNELEEAVSIYPDAETFYYLGYAYYMKGRAGDSESRKNSMENFDKAFELNPNFTPTKFKPENPAPTTEAGTKQPAPSEPEALLPLAEADKEKQAQTSGSE